MKPGLTFALSSVLVGILLSACGPSQAEVDATTTQIAANIFATQTAQAPTATPTHTATLTPTSTPTPTPTSTFTPAPTFTSTPTPFPIPAGWVDHTVEDFAVALPEGWKAIDIDREGVQALWDSLSTFNTEWAKNIQESFSAEGVQKTLKLFAIDQEPAGAGYATLTVTSRDAFMDVDIPDLCEQLPAAYETMGVEVVDKQCDLKIDGFDAVRFTIKVEAGKLVVKQAQYLVGKGRTLWVLSMGVEEPSWDKYLPLFEQVVETFRILK